ncbi:MAG: sigma-70 family RNA polymerase sigma factor [Myxococcota bacterium]
MQAIPTGFETVYRREFPFVWAAARRLGVPPSVLDDAVQDVFLTAYRRWDDLDCEVSPRAWLYGVTRRVAFRYRRTQARTARRRSVVSQASRSRHEPHAELEGAHDVDAVLAGLEARRREVFVMSELLDMSGPEIAAELKIPLNTVYSRLRLARRQLERTMTRERTAAWVRITRRRDRAPDGQARRSWALLLPMLRRGAVVGTAGAAGAVGTIGTGVLGTTTAKLVGIGAVVAVVGAIVLGGSTGKGDDPAPGVATIGSEQRAAAEAALTRPVAVEHAGGFERGGVEHAGVEHAGAEHAGVEPGAVARMNEGPSPGSLSVESPASSSSVAAAAVPGHRGRASRGPARSSAAGSGEPVTSATASSDSESSRLAAEVAVLDRATEALRAGQAARSLQWLAEHERRFPAGRLVDVRKATRVRVLCRLGREAQARAEAAALRREHPGSAVARRVPDACENA